MPNRHLAGILLGQVAPGVRRVYWFFLGQTLRFFKRLLLAAVVFLASSYLLPDAWGPLVSVVLPFVLAFLPFGIWLFRSYRELQREEAYAEVVRREREQRQLLEMAKREGIPEEVFRPLDSSGGQAPAGRSEGR